MTPNKNTCAIFNLIVYFLAFRDFCKFNLFPLDTRPLRLTLTHTITQPVRRSDEEYSERCLSVFIDSVARVFSIETIRLQFRTRRFYVIDCKKATLLRRVTTPRVQSEYHRAIHVSDH
jgi:hypothetical protein